jgi:hypothetical protein
VVQQPVTCAVCIYGFHMILSVNSDYFLECYQPVDLCNGKVLCFRCGMGWILKYCFDEHHLPNVKEGVNYGRHIGRLWWFQITSYINQNMPHFLPTEDIVWTEEPVLPLTKTVIYIWSCSIASQCVHRLFACSVTLIFIHCVLVNYQLLHREVSAHVSIFFWTTYFN